MATFSVGVFFRGNEIDESPFDVKYYRQSYFELDREIAALGGSMVIARGQATYKGNGWFTQAWKIDAPGSYTELTDTHVDVVFDKGGFVSDNTVPQFNHPEINQICADKHQMYERFKQFCPLTLMVKNREEYLAALGKIMTPIAVVKPVDGFEGRGILIDQIGALAEADAEVIFPSLVQEFIDTSQGIPGIVEGHHDLRVAIYNGEIIYVYVRTPPPGGLMANVSQGGSFVMVPSNKLPEEVFPIIANIDAEYERIHERFYSIDLGFTSRGPQLIEMNSRLGLLPNCDSPEFITLKKKLAQTFKSLVQQRM